MALPDSTVTERTNAVLESGEQVLGYGLILDQDPLKGTLAFLGAATDRRLLLFESDYKIGWSVSAVPKAGNLTEWRYCDLMSVQQGKGQHHFVRLEAHPGRGPFAHEPPNKAWRRYEIPFKVKELDAHAKFVAEFPLWLEQRFRSGSLAQSASAASAPNSGGGPSVGGQVLVVWSDGNRYPATVTGMQNGQAQVAFPNGQSFWVPLAAIAR